MYIHTLHYFTLQTRVLWHLAIPLHAGLRLHQAGEAWRQRIVAFGCLQDFGGIHFRHRNWRHQTWFIAIPAGPFVRRLLGWIPRQLRSDSNRVRKACSTYRVVHTDSCGISKPRRLLFPLRFEVIAWQHSIREIWPNVHIRIWLGNLLWEVNKACWTCGWILRSRTEFFPWKWQEGKFYLKNAELACCHAYFLWQELFSPELCTYPIHQLVHMNRYYMEHGPFPLWSSNHNQNLEDELKEEVEGGRTNWKQFMNSRDRIINGQHPR